tara:strand:- start:82 stop:315 length:234 start_codon:yes stop_codon:yes gene_type:complete
MEHPLVGQLKDLSLEEIQSKLQEISKKLSFAYRSGNNALSHQLQMVQQSYTEEYNRKMRDLMPKDDDNDHNDKIDIS